MFMLFYQYLLIENFLLFSCKAAHANVLFQVHPVDPLCQSYAEEQISSSQTKWNKKKFFDQQEKDQYFLDYIYENI